MRYLLGVVLFVLGLPSVIWASGLAPVVEEIDDISVLPLITESGKQPKTCGSWVQFTVTATDPENDNLYYLIEEIQKDGAVIDSVEMMSLDDATGEFSWCARTSQVGEFDLRILVKDCRPSQEQSDCSGNEVRRSFHAEVLLPDICTGSSSACTFLKAPERSDVAGSTGDFYLAGDYETDTQYHAVITVGILPQLDFLDKLKGSDFSLNPSASRRGFEGRVFPGKVVIGNSSTAITSGTGWGGHVRKNCMPSQYSVDRVYAQYRSNHHMWYPEHLDHDDKDHHFAKIPYCSASQGSSGTELDEIGKFVRTLAAFKGPVKERLREEGLLVPILQMIFRRTRVDSDGEYLSGLAHPNAFDNTSNMDAMIEMAYGIDADTIPPVAQIEVVDHNFDGERGRDYFARKSEVHFETPASVAFIYRGREYTKQIIASARDSYDLNGRTLSYHWRVLRGATEHVRITSLEDDASVVKIEIDYHPETTIENSTRLTNSVEVGLFVHNGAYYSAPAFITSHTLANETRDFLEGKVERITYDDTYVDPLIKGQVDWDHDDFAYNPSGKLTGWTRHFSGGASHQFDADGHCTNCDIYSLRGRLAIGSMGMAGIKVVATHYDGLEGPHVVYTDGDGNFTFPGLPDGSYHLEAQSFPNGYTSSRNFVTVDGNNVNDVKLTVSCKPGFTYENNACVGYNTVAGQIVFSGAGLANIEVSGEDDSGRSYSAVTDSQGYFLLGFNQSGLLTITPKSVDFDFQHQGWSNPVSVDIDQGPVSITGKNFIASCTKWATDKRCEALLRPFPPGSLRIIKKSDYP